MAEAVLFYLFAAGVLAGGSQVVLRRNPIYGAVSLVGCFFFLAGIYVLLSAHLIQNVAIAEWAPALLVAGLPPALGEFVARAPGARALTRPTVALPLWFAAIA